MTSESAEEVLAPLFRFLRRRHLEPPRVNLLPSDKLPEPYRRLLMHNALMTTKLEAFHEEEIVLSVRHEEHSKDWYHREVVLRGMPSNRPVEYGAIDIALTAFPKELRAKILDGSRPLGGLLVDHTVDFESRPEAFFKVDPCHFIADSLECDRSAHFYGRVNQLSFRSGRTFAQVVEILPRMLSDFASG